MSNPRDEAGKNPDGDARLAEVLDAWIAERRAGKDPDLEGFANANPQLADEVRKLWAAVMITDDLASLSMVEEEVAAAESSGASIRKPAIGDLPRRVGDYELEEEVGRGGMGVVYRARQLSLGRVTAVKMILKGEMASAADVARFRAEAESAAQLDHANIIPVYEVGEFDELPYFSMKFASGGSLSKALEKGPLPARESARIFLPICRAIATAHKRGVLHRDLKPSNILFDEAGRPMVTDFGLAKRVATKNTMTRTGAIMGTPSYMPPEQAAGSRGVLSPASDVYSLGAVLYHMISGRPPFQAESAVDTLLMVLEQEPLPARMLNPGVNADLEMIARKCLEKSPSLRYATADELADDVQAFLADEPIKARTTSLRQWFGRTLGETRNAPILENWGLLWILHSAVVLCLSLITNWLQHKGIDHRWPYVSIWTIGLGAWAMVFWGLRRRGGPITFVERQIAHIWGASVLSSSILFGVETAMGLRVLALSPVLALLSGSVFFVKAGILSGSFYVQSAACFLCAIPMALFPEFGLTIFGIVSFFSFFVPGLKYYRQRNGTIRAELLNVDSETSID